MATSLVLTIDLTRDKVSEVVRSSDQDREGMRQLINVLEAANAGHEAASVDVQYSDSAAAVAASGTLTLASVIATDAITIGTTTFTFTSTPTLATDVEVDGATNADDAAALAAAINAHPTVSQIVTASAASAVVTVRAKQKGVVGNFIPLSSADATITASGAFLTGGTGGATTAAVTYACGR